jgi:hypothetical protein
MLTIWSNGGNKQIRNKLSGFNKLKFILLSINNNSSNPLPHDKNSRPNPDTNNLPNLVSHPSALPFKRAPNPRPRPPKPKKKSLVNVRVAVKLNKMLHFLPAVTCMRVLVVRIVYMMEEEENVLYVVFLYRRI